MNLSQILAFQQGKSLEYNACAIAKNLLIIGGWGVCVRVFFQAGSVSGSLLDSEEEDREGLTCAVCLDVYFSPYSCQPCGHIFCEPCLRTITKNRPTSTPCPLCRTFISQTTFHRGECPVKKTNMLSSYLLTVLIDDCGDRKVIQTRTLIILL